MRADDGIFSRTILLLPIAFVRRSGTRAFCLKFGDRGVPGGQSDLSHFGHDTPGRFKVALGVDLCDVSCAVPEDDLRSLNAVLAA